MDAKILFDGVIPEGIGATGCSSHIGGLTQAPIDNEIQDPHGNNDAQRDQ